MVVNHHVEDFGKLKQHAEKSFTHSTQETRLAGYRLQLTVLILRYEIQNLYRGDGSIDRIAARCSTSGYFLDKYAAKPSQIMSPNSERTSTCLWKELTFWERSQLHLWWENYSAIPRLWSQDRRWLAFRALWTYSCTFNVFKRRKVLRPPCWGWSSSLRTPDNILWLWLSSTSTPAMCWLCTSKNFQGTE